MRQYKKAVLFIDILGIGDLTRQHIALTAADYSAWNVKHASDRNEQYLCAKVLLAFRAVLNALQKELPNSQVAQLSDCVFIWSADPAIVVRASRYVMSRCARAGVFCRGGIRRGKQVPQRSNI